MYWEYKFLQSIKIYTRHPFLDVFMYIVSTLGNGGAIWILSCLLLLIFPSYRNAGLSCILALSVNGFITNIVLKPCIARIRPFDRYADIISSLHTLPKDFSFPSGHTSASFAFATTLYFYNHKLGILAYIMATLIALSRMYLMVHYPTDIMGGTLLGIGIAIICFKLYTLLLSLFPLLKKHLA